MCVAGCESIVSVTSNYEKFKPRNCKTFRYVSRQNNILGLYETDIKLNFLTVLYL